ncbi:hypothetical protein AAIA72_09510 [Hahella sp. SMD15-11]|uniref:RecBCD enzyme subunit RecD N-terminal domain-containing protein n=1 Tax=Thermohahella caldifontis TaxID=3142973 RepID=A0AB39URX3_9GAMM
MKRQDWKHVAARLGEVDYGQWAAVTEMLSLYHLENDADRTLLAHVALALLQAQAEGHVCLDVNRLAGTRLWTDAQAEPPRRAFNFPVRSDCMPCSASCRRSRRTIPSR